MNAGFWELPNASVGDFRDETVQLAAEQELGFRPAGLKSAGQIAHSITNNRFLLTCYVVAPPSRSATPHRGKWIALATLDKTPLSGAHARLLRMIPQSSVSSDGGGGGAA